MTSKKYLSLSLVALLLNLVCAGSATAKPKADKEVQLAEKVKAKIAKLGTGPQARVEVKLRDNTKVKGYISKFDDTYFVVTDAKSGVANAIPYPQVKQVKRNNLSREEIGLIALTATFVVLLVLVAHSK
jgi:small nuclear ribonucleoprotein (snRNP)-like protein